MFFWSGMVPRAPSLDLYSDCDDKMLFWGHTSVASAEEKFTIGHESTGTVVSVGSNVQGFNPGDPVGCLMCSYACCMPYSMDCPQSKELMGWLKPFRWVRRMPRSQCTLCKREWSSPWIFYPWSLCRLFAVGLSECHGASRWHGSCFCRSFILCWTNRSVDKKLSPFLIHIPLSDQKLVWQHTTQSTNANWNQETGLQSLDVAD